MTTRHRLALLTLVTVGALVGATPAMAIFEPHLFVTSSKPAVGAAGVKIRYVSARPHDATARLKVGVPKGYGITPSASSIGAATATVLLTDRNRIVNAKGTLQAGTASQFSRQATECTGRAAHSATWVLTLNAAGTTLRVPIFVDTISSGPIAAFASATLELCLGAPDTPRATPGRPPLGAKVLTLTLNVRAVKNPATGGTYRWRATATPYSAGIGQANARGTVEIQSLSVVPISLTLEGSATASPKAGFSRVTLSGRLSGNGNGIAGTFVDLLRGGKKIARLTTKGDGAFTATGDIRRTGSLAFVARATIPDKDLGGGGCIATFKPPDFSPAVPCFNATLPGFTVASRVFRLSL